MPDAEADDIRELFDALTSHDAHVLHAAALADWLSSLAADGITETPDTPVEARQHYSQYRRGSLVGMCVYGCNTICIVVSWGMVTC